MGNLLTIVVVLAAGYAYLRRESVSVWKSVAEGLEKKVALLEEQNRLLAAENAVLRAKPDLEQLSGLTIRHGLLLDGIEERLQSHTRDAQEWHSKVINSLDGITAAVGQLSRSLPKA